MKHQFVPMNPEKFFLLILKKRPQKHQLRPPPAQNMKGTPHNQDQTD